MSALAMPRRAAGPFAVAPAKDSAASRSSMWSEPEPWIVAVLLATGVAVIARHPIARAIGTEVDAPTLTPSVVATPAPKATTPAAAAAAAAIEPLPTHAPRDPFHALVAASKAVIAQTAPSSAAPQPKYEFPGITPVTALQPAAAAPAFPGVAPTSTTTTTTAKPTISAPKSVTTASVAETCAGTVHTVAVGDSLWTIAAKAVKSSETARVTVAWHRIYDANRAPLGDNPSLLRVGTKICVPSSI